MFFGVEHIYIFSNEQSTNMNCNARKVYFTLHVCINRAIAIDHFCYITPCIIVIAVCLIVAGSRHSSSKPLARTFSTFSTLMLQFQYILLTHRPILRCSSSNYGSTYGFCLFATVLNVVT